MPKTSKEFLNHVEKPSILDGLLIGRKDPLSQARESKHQTYLNKKESPFTPLPKSQVLGKVKDFLEVMAKANQDLKQNAQQIPPSNYDIEVLNDDEKEYIQMDLLLGVADLHSDEAVTAAEASMSCFQPSAVSASSCSSDSGSVGDESDDSDDEYKSKSTEHCMNVNELMREAKPNKRPKVVMLD